MKKIQLITGCIAAIAFVACSGGNVRYPDKTTKVDLTGTSVLVVAEDNASGDASAAKAFVAAVGQKSVRSKFCLPCLRLRRVFQKLTPNSA